MVYSYLHRAEKITQSDWEYEYVVSGGPWKKKIQYKIFTYEMGYSDVQNFNAIPMVYSHLLRAQKISWYDWKYEYVVSEGHSYRPEKKNSI